MKYYLKRADQYHLNDLSIKTERYIKRKVRSLVLGKDEFGSFQARMKDRPWLLIWEAKKSMGYQDKGIGYNHRTF